MARPRSINQNDVESVGDTVHTLNDSLEGNTPDIRDGDAYLNQLIAEAGEDVYSTWKVMVYRPIPGRGEYSKLFTCTPAEVGQIADRLRDDYGGGRFEVRMFQGFVCVGRTIMNIEAPKTKNVIEQTVNNGNEVLIKTMLDGFNKITETMRAASVPAVNNYDPARMFESMIGMFGNFQAMMPKAEVNQTEQSINLIMKGIELANLSGGNNNGESGMIDVVRDLLKSPLINNVLQAASAQQAPKAMPVNEIPRVTVQPKADDVRSTYINMLLQKAKNGSSPELYADYILDNVPEDMIRKYLLAPGVLDEIIKETPDVAVYKNWFVALQNGIIEMLDGNADIENANSNDVRNAT